MPGHSLEEFCFLVGYNFDCFIAYFTSYYNLPVMVMHITIGHIEKVAAFIDVCIKGLVDCLLADFIQELPEGRWFTDQEATQVMNLILYLVSVTIVQCAGGEQGL